MGCCDNKYKVCIKIIVYEYGIEEICVCVEECYKVICLMFKGFDVEFFNEIKIYFVVFVFCNVLMDVYDVVYGDDLMFCSWVDINLIVYK